MMIPAHFFSFHLFSYSTTCSFLFDTHWVQKVTLISEGCSLCPLFNQPQASSGLTKSIFSFFFLLLLPIIVLAPENYLPLLFPYNYYFQSHGITYELNVSSSCPKSEWIQDSHFLRIPVNDNHHEQLLPYFPIAFDFLGKPITMRILHFPLLHPMLQIGYVSSLLNGREKVALEAVTCLMMQPLVLMDAVLLPAFPHQGLLNVRQEPGLLADKSRTKTGNHHHQSKKELL